MAQKHISDLTKGAIQDAVRDAIGSAAKLFPCYQLCEGSDHSVWLIGDSLILRGLPATGRDNGWSEASSKRDTEVYTLVRKHLTKPSVVPKIHQTINIDGWICNLETRISGNSLEDVTPTVQTEDDLAEVLKVLASVPIKEAKAATSFVEDRQNLRKRVFKALRAWDELKSSGYIPAQTGDMHKLLTQKLKEVKSLGEPVYKPVLLHGDIKGEHIFIDPSTGALNGIVDWSDALVGDPCRDIADLSKAVGGEMARRIGLKAGHSQYTVEKGLVFAICLTILSLEDRILGDDDSPEDLLRKQFCQAFEGTDFAQVFAANK